MTLVKNFKTIDTEYFSPFDDISQCNFLREICRYKIRKGGWGEGSLWGLGETFPAFSWDFPLWENVGTKFR